MIIHKLNQLLEKSDFDKAVLDYHRYPKPGKLEISAIKNMLNQRDLALTYSPGVAAECLEIENDPEQAGDLTWLPNLSTFGPRSSNRPESLSRSSNTYTSLHGFAE